MRRPAAVLALGILALAASTSALAQVNYPEDEGFHNSTYVGDEPEEARLAFFRAEELLAADRPLEAGREILALLRSSARGRVRFGERLVLPLETAAMLFLIALPEDVRAGLREEAAAIAPEIPADDDRDALRRFARRQPLSPESEAAWLRAGTLALLEGDPAAAAADLERIVHWPSAAPRRLAPLAAARLLQAVQRMGERPVEGALAAWPPPGESVVERAGAGRAWGELLAEALAAPAPADRGGATLHGDDARAARPPFPDGPVRPLAVFRHGHPADLVPDPEYALHRERFLKLEHISRGHEHELHDLPLRAPVIAGDRLITFERMSFAEDAPAAIHVRSLATFQDLYEPIRTDFDLHIDPADLVPVLDRAALSLHGDLLLLTLELREPGQYARELMRTGDSAKTALFGLDLAREGFVRFGVTSDDLAADPELSGYVLSGPAVGCGDRVLVPASRLAGRETECALLAFDARDGRPAGQAFLARAASVPLSGDRMAQPDLRRVNPSPAALRDGVVFVCTNLGVIAAVRADDLEVAWIFRYHRIPPPVSDRWERAVQFGLGPWLGRAPIALADRVIATPSDSQYLYSLARWPNARGDLLLNEPIEKQARLALLGATERECCFLVRVGDAFGIRYVVEATDHDGAHLWRTFEMPVGQRITGLPAFSQGHVFLPTDRNIYPVDLEREGDVRFPIQPPPEVGMPYPEFGTFGDLAVTDRLLISTSQDFTIVFGPAE